MPTPMPTTPAPAPSAPPSTAPPRLAVDYDARAAMKALAERRLAEHRARLLAVAHDPADVEAYLRRRRENHDRLLNVVRKSVDPRGASTSRRGVAQ